MHQSRKGLVELLIRNFAAYFNHTLETNPKWLPDPQSNYANVLGKTLQTTPQFGALGADLLLSVLKDWKAGRGGKLANSAYVTKQLRNFNWKTFQGMELPSSAPPLQTIIEAFSHFESLKTTKRQRFPLMPASKLLHNLLPNLIVPMDNQFTAPWFFRNELPAALDKVWLTYALEEFAVIAQSAGKPLLDNLACTPLEKGGVRIGYGRVIDWAICGFVSKHKA